MDLTNRVLIVTGALLWIFVILVVILLAWGVPDESIDRLRDLADYMADHNDDASKLIITFGGFILVLLAGIVIIFEIAPPEGGSLKVQNVGAGGARITTDEIKHRLEEELRALPHINDVQATVQARGRKAEVSLDLHVGAEAELAAAAEEACRCAREVIEQRMGVALARAPQAQLHYRELRVARPQEGPQSQQGEPLQPPTPSWTPRTPKAVSNEPRGDTGLSDEPSQATEEDHQAGA